MDICMLETYQHHIHVVIVGKFYPPLNHLHGYYFQKIPGYLRIRGFPEHCFYTVIHILHTSPVNYMYLKTPQSEKQPYTGGLHVTQIG